MTRPAPGGSAGHPLEVLWAFLKLGLTAFGGPIAHIGYFRDEFVRRRQWLDEAAYADLVALCQFLPGPAPSQVGFGIGLRRAGPLGALAAWTGAVAGPVDAVLAMAGFCLLTALKTPPVWIVFLGAAAGLLQHLLGIG